jgi:hypothetical protein
MDGGVMEGAYLEDVEKDALVSTKQEDGQDFDALMKDVILTYVKHA